MDELLATGMGTDGPETFSNADRNVAKRVEEQQEYRRT